MSNHDDQGAAPRAAARRALLENRLKGKLGGGAAQELGPTRRERTGSAELSFAQKRLWFFDQLEPGTALYNVPCFVKLVGTLRVDALEASLNEVVRRHEVLRSYFPSANGSPMQRVLPALRLALVVQDLSTLEPGARDEALRARIAAVAREPFWVDRGPLLRVELVRLASDTHALLLCLHHLVTDGWSAGLLLDEVARLYAAHLAGKDAALPELPLQYADFAAWQAERLSQQKVAAELSHWTRRLHGAPPLLSLPTDRPRPRSQTFRGATLPFSLDAALSARIRTVAGFEGATVFMVLLAAFKSVLHRDALQDDLVVGTPVAGRTHTSVEPLIGFFANTLALRTDLSGNPTFRELLGRVRETCLDAFAHQELPFEKLVEALRPEGASGYNPIFQTLFVLQNAPLPRLALPGLVLSPLFADTGTAKFDLVLLLDDSGPAITGGLEHNTDLFSRRSAERFVERWTRFVEAVVAWPTLRIDQVPLISERERRQVLDDWNQSRQPKPGFSGAHQWVERQVEETPDAVAVQAPGGESLTYRQLWACADLLAAQLVENGAQPDRPVAIALGRLLENVIAIFGCLKAGAAYLPLDPSYPAERRAMMLEDARVGVVITDAATRAQTSFGSARVVEVDGLRHSAMAPTPHRLSATVSPEQLAYVIFTSGSTGRPKGVGMSHGALVNLMAWQKRMSRAGPGTRTIQFASLSFDVSVQEIFCTLCTGGTLVLVRDEERLDPEALFRRLKDERIERLYLPMVALQNLASVAPKWGGALPALREVCAGGEQVKITEQVRTFFTANPELRLHNDYGPTETHACTWWIQAGPISEVEDLPPIGVPLDNCRNYVLDAHLNPVPVGVPGELYVAGDVLARGYVGRPELTAERFIPDPYGPPGTRMYRTGDLARHQADGTLEFLGRADHQVKIRGFRVEPGEVEAALSRHPDVKQCAVVARVGAQTSGQTRLYAYVVGRSGPPSSAALRAALRETLPEYMVPSAIIPLDHMPLTPSGKLDRAALPEPSKVARDERPATPPRTTWERKVATAWSELLDLPQVSVDESFFELGGHSLLATRLAARIEELTGVALPLRALFEAPTVAGQATLIEERSGHDAAAGGLSIPVVPRDEALPVSFAQQRLWFLDQFESGSAFYNMHLAVRLSGPLQPEQLGAALRELVLRHEILRTRLVTLEGQPRQRIDPSPEVAVERVSVRRLGSAERERAAAEHARRWAERPFDLARGPLLRAHLCELDATDHLLFVSLHHSVADGGSLPILIRDVSELYAARVAQRPPVLPVLPIQYADYAVWQRRRSEAGALDGQLGYWRRKLATEVPVLELPADRARPPRQRYRGGTVVRELPVELRRSVAALAERHQATPFMVLLAAYHALLFRLTGQRQLRVGSPISGRSAPELNELVGCFANTLVLHCEVDPRAPFTRLLAQLRETCLEAYENAEVPFEELVEALQPQRSPQHAPVFQTLLVHNVDLPRPLGLGPLAATPWPLEGATSIFDLTLSITEGTGRLSLDAEYDSDLFDRGTVEGWLSSYHVLLEGIVEAPTAPISALPVLDRATRTRVLEQWNATRVPHVERCVHHLIEEHAAQAPDRPAVQWGERVLSYGALDARANQIAHALRGAGVAPEDVVGLCIDRSFELYLGMVGILKAGAAFLPLDPALPAERLAFMLADSRAKVLLCDPRVLANFGAAAEQVTVVPLIRDGDGVRSEPTTPVPVQASPLNVAYVIYTSGSTGQPKGAMNEHRALLNYCHVTREAYAFEANDRVLQFSSVSWDVATVEEIFPTLTCGATLVVRTPEMLDAHDGFWHRLEQAQVSVVDLPTAFWNEVTANLPAHGRRAPPSLRLLIIGGERAAPERVREWIERLHRPVRLVNTYGVSESTSVSALGDLTREDAEAKEATIGRAVRNTRLYVLDARFAPVPPGVVGELYLAGLGLGRGYLHQPELTATKYLPDPFSPEPGARMYRTGDLGRFLPDGRLQHCGRADSQVKIRGYRIELGEVEAAVRRAPTVHDAVVLAREDVPGQRRLVAYVVPSVGANAGGAGQGAFDATALRDEVAQLLPEYMVPSAWVVLESLPVTETGKLDRRALSAPSANAEPGVAHVPPEDDLERTVAAIWEELLGVSRVGRHDDFFALGGHSLLSVRLLGRIRERTGRSIPLARLFGASTLARLCEELERADWGGSLLVRLRAAGEGRPLFLVHPWEGSVFCYQTLATLLHTDCPIYGVQARGLDPAEAPLDDVTRMATAYLEELRAVQPTGPYRIGGWSMGGLIALEMANQLTTREEEVELLALIDAPAPVEGPLSTTEQDTAWLGVSLLSQAYGLGLRREDFATADEALARAREQIRSGARPVSSSPFWLPDGADPAAEVQRLLRVHRAHERAMDHHRPERRFPRRALYLRAADGTSEAEVRAGFERWVDTLEVHTVPGDHHGMVLDPANARVLAQLLDRALSGAAPSGEETR